MHVLVTTDTVGGVWTYTRELVAGLLGHGARVTLVSFGGVPNPAQTRWMTNLDGLDYRPTAFKLEWMQDSADSVKASARYLLDVIHETQPDLLHFNQFYYGALDCDLPRLVVAHSDVVSWWVAVHGEEPSQTPWIAWYRDAVTRGLAEATAAVAPSQWMLEQVKRNYLQPLRSAVIYNGRTPGLFNPHATKEERIVTVGRLWDEGKNARLLLGEKIPAQVFVVGAGRHPEEQGQGFPGKTLPNVHLQPQASESQMAEILARAAIYVAPSRYEPFGLAPLEAALSRCALVMSDIQPFRELWENAAIFFRNNDAGDLRRALDLLVSDAALCQKYANLAGHHARQKFSAERMTSEYLKLYQALTPAAVAA